MSDAIKPDTNPTRDFLNEKEFARCWRWLAKNGHVEEGDDAFDFAHEWMKRLGWPVPSAALLLDIHKRYADLRFANAQQAAKQKLEAQPA